MESRPPHIQAAIQQWPVGTVLEHDGETLYLCGYNEAKDAETKLDIVMLIFSVINPWVDYDAALLPRNRRYVCSHHLAPVT